MKTEILKVKADSPDPEKVKKIADVLRRGGIAALPTETVYGLAVNAEDKSAIAKLYEVKKRPAGKPFTIQIADYKQLKKYMSEVTPRLEIIFKECWPGALTVVVETVDGKVGLRMPDHQIALAVIREAGIPLAVTSANISGEEAAFCALEVIKTFDGLIDIIVDDDARSAGVESTVLDCTSTPFQIIRKGILAHKLEIFLRLYG